MIKKTLKIRFYCFKKPVKIFPIIKNPKKISQKSGYGTNKMTLLKTNCSALNLVLLQKYFAAPIAKIRLRPVRNPSTKKVHYLDSLFSNKKLYFIFILL